MLSGDINIEKKWVKFLIHVTLQNEMSLTLIIVKLWLAQRNLRKFESPHMQKHLPRDVQ